MANCCFKDNSNLFNIGGGCENYEEVANFESLPIAGDEDTIYKTLDDGKIFIWDGSQYVELSVQTTPIGATLMKTGQTVSYRTGDDGDIEAGRATSFTVLASNNPFGNTNRFTDELGGQTYTNNIVIDWSTYDGATVLGYTRSLTLTGNISWNTAVDGALTYSTGGFSNWRLTNRTELDNLYNYELSEPYAFSPFINNVGSMSFWSSTTRKGFTSQAFLFGSVGNIGLGTKTDLSGGARYCRTFTVTGTTLT